MKLLNIDKVQPGMLLADSVYNLDGSVELLTVGTVLTERHIKLIHQLGVRSLHIYEESEYLEAPMSERQGTLPETHAETIEKAATKSGAVFDVNQYMKEIEQLDEEDHSSIIRNVVNQNMKISVLTGSGNIPIDEKHKQMIEETHKVFENLKEVNEVNLDIVKHYIEEALPDMIRNNDVLMRLSQLKDSDDYTYQHSLRVSILATMIGKWLGYDEVHLQELATSGLMFDMGKMKIPDFILKKELISEDEYEVIKKHAQFGYSVLMKTKGITNNMKYSALQHHERMDGSGYPMRLKSGQIHEFAKIIMVCDIFDAMTTDRPYRKKVSPFQALEYISWQSGHTLDSKICYVFITNISEFFHGKSVVLNTGEKGRIVYIDVNYPTRPLVALDNGGMADLVRDRSIEIVEIVHHSHN